MKDSCYNATANLSSERSYVIEAETNLANDESDQNDCVDKRVFNLFPNVKIIYKVLFDIIIDMKRPVLVKINLLFIFSHIFYIKKKNYDELTKIPKLCKDIDFKVIDKMFNNQIEIEYTNIYEHFYNIL